MKPWRKNRFIRSTMPLDSGSFGGSWRMVQPSTPANDAAESVSRPCPMPLSLSQISRSGTTAASWISDHIPPNRSGAVRVGIIRAWMKPENVLVMTSTGGLPCWP